MQNTKKAAFIFAGQTRTESSKLRQIANKRTKKDTKGRESGNRERGMSIFAR